MGVKEGENREEERIFEEIWPKHPKFYDKYLRVKQVMKIDMNLLNLINGIY